MPTHALSHSSILGGATLFETLGALAIISIVATSATLTIPKHSPKRTSRQLHSIVEYALLRAITAESPITVTMTEHHVLMRGDRPIAVDLPSPLSILNAPLEIVVTSTPWCSPASVLISDGEEHCTIHLSLRCRLRTECDD